MMSLVFSPELELHTADCCMMIRVEELHVKDIRHPLLPLKLFAGFHRLIYELDTLDDVVGLEFGFGTP